MTSGYGCTQVIIIYDPEIAGDKYKQRALHLTDLYKYIGHFSSEVSDLSLCLNQ